MGIRFSSCWKASTVGTMSPDWSSLSNDIWSQITENLPLEDHIRCRSVCSSWLSIFRSLNRCSSQPRAPWLLIPGRRSWKFFDIASNKMMHKINLPDPLEIIIVGSSKGWLILADELTADLRLFNPFIREEIQLPPTITFPSVVRVVRDALGRVTKYGFKNLHKSCNEIPQIVCRWFHSASLTPCDSGYIVVATHRESDDLAFARTGDKAWTALEIPGGLPYYYVYTLSEGLLYVTNQEGRVLSFNLSSRDPSPPCLLNVAPPCGIEFEMYWVPAIFPESGEVLLLQLGTSAYHDKKDIRAFQLDKLTGEWVEMLSLLENSLFLVSGEDPRAVMCLPAKYHPKELKGNFLYFTQDGLLRGLDMEAHSIRTYSSTKICYKDGYFGQPDHVWVNPVLTNLYGSSDVAKNYSLSSN